MMTISPTTSTQTNERELSFGARLMQGMKGEAKIAVIAYPLLGLVGVIGGLVANTIYPGFITIGDPDPRVEPRKFGGELDPNVAPPSADPTENDYDRRTNSDATVSIENKAETTAHAHMHNQDRTGKSNAIIDFPIVSAPTIPPTVTVIASHLIENSSEDKLTRIKVSIDKSKASPKERTEWDKFLEQLYDQAYADIDGCTRSDTKCEGMKTQKIIKILGINVIVDDGYAEKREIREIMKKIGKARQETEATFKATGKLEYGVSATAVR